MAVRSLRDRGLAGTLNLAGVIGRRIALKRWILYRLSNRWYRYLDERFDQRFAVDTAGIVELPELESDPRFKHCRRYEPTPQPLFFRMLRQLNVDYSRFVFVDFGCGKGKALLLAAQLPFKQIIGVEISAKLIRIAEDNLKSYLATRRCNEFQLVCADAGEFRIPEEAAIFFFYDPFDEEVTRKVLENIRGSFASAPRESYIVYLNPVERDLLDGSRFLTPIKQTYLYSIYEASGV